jgi:uncharacterized protein YqjF (DUF2071 family)
MPAARDFRYQTLRETDHRPWPMPRTPWVMTQTWHDLLFAHWPIDFDTLRAAVPRQLNLDRFGGSAWIGVVPFEMSNVTPRFVPSLRGLSAFPEINVRTYVTVGGRPGVFFFSLDATNPVAVWSARLLFRLPYFRASMKVERLVDAIAYRSWRSGGDAVFEAQYAPAGASFAASRDSLEYFLTERYCLYTVGRSGRVSRADVHHAPWSLQRAQADIRRNSMATATGISLPAAPPHLLFAKRQDTVVWLPSGSAV